MSDKDLVGLHGGDDRGVDEGFGPLGRVLDERLPLPRQPDELLLLLVKVCVDAVLEVGRGGDLDTRLLLLGEHGGGGWSSDLQEGGREQGQSVQVSMENMLLSAPVQSEAGEHK